MLGKDLKPDLPGCEALDGVHEMIEFRNRQVQLGRMP